MGAEFRVFGASFAFIAIPERPSHDYTDELGATATTVPKHGPTDQGLACCADEAEQSEDAQAEVQDRVEGKNGAPSSA